MAIAGHSEKLRELVDENAEDEPVATGFTFSEDRSGIRTGTCSSPTCPATSGGSTPRPGSRGGDATEFQVQRDDARRQPRPDRLRARDERPSWRERKTARARCWPTTTRAQYLNSPNDVCVRSRRVDLLHRPVVRALARGRGQARARAGLAGRLPDPAGRRPGRHRARGRQERVRGCRTALCFSPDESLDLHQRHSPGHTSRAYDVSTTDGTLSNGRIFFGGIGSGAGRGWGPEDGMKMRRARQHLGDGTERGLGDLGRSRAPRRDQRPGEHWQPVLGGDDWHTLFIPSSTSLYAIRTKVGPRHEPYMT